jgi:hypothetical protein
MGGINRSGRKFFTAETQGRKEGAKNYGNDSEGVRRLNSPGGKGAKELIFSPFVLDEKINV